MIETARLLLRSWRDEDVVPFNAINGDPRVMATLGPLQTLDETAALVARMQAINASCGRCFWAVECKADTAPFGWCGIVRGPEAAPIAGKPEIGWRLAYDYWGQGFAREAAQASLDWGFANLPDDAIWAITTPGNPRSWGLMERLKMRRHPNLDFNHPAVVEGSPLRTHRTYSIARPV